MPALPDNTLGVFLKDRRGRLDPGAFGLNGGRRRTPGLRREEVAQRACVSATWYTWLEQGRGGAPSTDVLDRLSRALELTGAEREHMFLLAQRRPPEVRYSPPEPISAHLQHVIDALEFSPAMVRTSAWDVVAWNRAAMAVLADWQDPPPERRNVLRRLFQSPEVRAAMPHWEQDARHAVAAFRLETARAGATQAAAALVEELSRASPEFAAMWRGQDVEAPGEGRKSVDHPRVGRFTLEYAGYAVMGRPDLQLVIYTPAGPDDAARIRALVEAGPPEAPAG